MMSTQKESEELLLTKFLKFANIPFKPIAMGDGPDAKVNCLFAGKWQTIGVEVTEYHVDSDQPGGSKGRQIEGFHQKLWGHVEQILERKDELLGFSCWLVYDWNHPPRAGTEHALADKLISFLEAKHDELPPDDERVAFDRYKGDFSGYPVMDACLKRIFVYNHGVKYPQQPWGYNAAAIVGVNPHIVTERIEQKTKKSRSYDWTGIDQKWLLICGGAAGVGVPHASAGPDLGGNRGKLNSPEILQAAAESGFDRIIFFERLHRWFHDIPTTGPAPAGN